MCLLSTSLFRCGKSRSFFYSSAIFFLFFRLHALRSGIHPRARRLLKSEKGGCRCRPAEATAALDSARNHSHVHKAQGSRTSLYVRNTVFALKMYDIVPIRTRPSSVNTLLVLSLFLLCAYFRAEICKHLARNIANGSWSEASWGIAGRSRTKLEEKVGCFEFLPLLSYACFCFCLFPPLGFVVVELLLGPNTDVFGSRTLHRFHRF